MLRENDSDSFPGAPYVAANPISGNECCLHSTMASLVDALVAAGAPYTFRGGRLFFDTAAAALDTICRAQAPNPEGMQSTDLEDFTPNSVIGTLFGEDEGEVWVTSTPNFELAPIRVEQTVDVWGDEQVEFTAVQGGLPTSPPMVYLWVVNACGRPSDDKLNVDFVV